MANNWGIIMLNNDHKKKSEFEIKVYVWNSELDKHPLAEPLEAGFRGGNIGHASVEVEQEINEENNKLIEKCLKNDIPVKYVPETNKKAAHWKVYISAWPNFNDKIYFKPLEIDFLDEREGRPAHYSEKAKKMQLNPQKRKVKGSLGERIVYQEPLYVIQYQGLNKNEINILNAKAKMAEIRSKINDYKFLSNELKKIKDSISQNKETQVTDIITEKLNELSPNLKLKKKLDKLDLNHAEEVYNNIQTEFQMNIIKINLFNLYKLENLIEIIDKNIEKDEVKVTPEISRVFNEVANSSFFKRYFKQKNIKNKQPFVNNIITKDEVENLKEIFNVVLNEKGKPKAIRNFFNEKKKGKIQLEKFINKFKAINPKLVELLSDQDYKLATKTVKDEESHLIIGTPFDKIFTFKNGNTENKIDGKKIIEFALKKKNADFEVQVHPFSKKNSFNCSKFTANAIENGLHPIIKAKLNTITKQISNLSSKKFFYSPGQVNLFMHEIDSIMNKLDAKNTIKSRKAKVSIKENEQEQNKSKINVEEYLKQNTFYITDKDPKKAYRKFISGYILKPHGVVKFNKETYDLVKQHYPAKVINSLEDLMHKKLNTVINYIESGGKIADRRLEEFYPEKASSKDYLPLLNKNKTANKEAREKIKKETKLKTKKQKKEKVKKIIRKI